MVILPDPPYNEREAAMYEQLAKERIAKLTAEREVAALEQERNELLTLRVERCAVCGEPSPTFCDEHSPSNARLREVIREHKHSCVKCGDCDFWDRYEQRLTEGENDAE